jgi:hypothetical protein
VQISNKKFQIPIANPLYNYKFTRYILKNIFKSYLFYLPKHIITSSLEYVNAIYAQNLIIYFLHNGYIGKLQIVYIRRYNIIKIHLNILIASICAHNKSINSLSINS